MSKRKKFLKLEFCRKKYGYSQKDMAVLLGLCSSSYSHKETGRVPFTFDEMKAIWEAINKKAKKAGDLPLTVDDIFFT